jgi:hypothetical protein
VVSFFADDVEQIDDISEPSKTPEETAGARPTRDTVHDEAVLVARGTADTTDGGQVGTHGFVEAASADENGGLNDRVGVRPPPPSIASPNRQRGDRGDRDDIYEPLSSWRRNLPSPSFSESQKTPTPGEGHPHLHPHVQQAKPSSSLPHPHHHHHHRTRRASKPEEDRRGVSSEGVVGDDNRDRDGWDGGRAFAVYGQDASDTSQSDLD